MNTRFMKGLAALVVLAGAATEVSCAGVQRTATMRQAYQEAAAEGFHDGAELLRNDLERERPFGYEPPVVPIVKDPDTMEIYVYPYRIGDDIAIGGYKMRIIVEPFRWNPELFADREPARQSQSTLPSVPGKK